MSFSIHIVYGYISKIGIIQKTNSQRVARLVETTQLLTYRQVKELFPDYEIIVERMLSIIPKSYIVFRASSRLVSEPAALEPVSQV